MSGRFSHNSIIGALTGVAILFGNFVSGIVVARVLGVTGSGTVAYILWLAFIVSTLVDMGGPSAAGRYVPECRGRGEHEQADQLSRHLLGRLAVAVAFASATIAIVAATPTLSAQLWHPEIEARLTRGGVPLLWFLLGAYVAAQVFGTFAYANLRGRLAFAAAARIALFSLLVQLTFVTAGSLLFGIAGAVLGYVLGQLPPALSALRFRGKQGPIDPPLIRRVSRYARYAWAANVANAVVWSRTEIFFLERSWGADDVGIFAAAMALTNLATQGPIMLTTGVLPLLAEQHGRSDIEAMKRTFAVGTRLLALLVFPCCLGTAAIMPVLIPLTYGPAFAPAVPAGIVMVCAAAISASAFVGTNLVYAMERSDFVFATSLIGSGIAIVAGIALVPAFGVLGAAAARVLIQLLLVGLGAWFIIRRLHCPLPFAALARLLAAASLSAVAAAFWVATIGGLASMLLAIPSAVVVYVLMLRLFDAVPSSDAALLRAATETLPPPLGSTAQILLRWIAPPG